jgi:F-type H+-transporting ATPase subunit b
MRRVVAWAWWIGVSVAVAAHPLVAQEGPPGGKRNLLSPNGGLMVWTLVVFVILMVVLSKFAFRPITAAVAAREKALEDALEEAKQDRAAAAVQLGEQRQLLERAHADAARVLAEARTAADAVRQHLLEQTHVQQQDLLARARKEIDDERDRAVAELRRQAVDLAILGAGKVIERNLDDATNRKLVDGYLAGLGPAVARR